MIQVPLDSLEEGPHSQCSHSAVSQSWHGSCNTLEFLGLKGDQVAKKESELFRTYLYYSRKGPLKGGDPISS